MELKAENEEKKQPEHEGEEEKEQEKVGKISHESGKRNFLGRTRTDTRVRCLSHGR